MRILQASVAVKAMGLSQLELARAARGKPDQATALSATAPLGKHSCKEGGSGTDAARPGRGCGSGAAHNRSNRDKVLETSSRGNYKSVIDELCQ
jgi:hypothetical protein